VMRVMARDHDEVDDGWLCDKGRYAYQHVHVDERITEPLVREGEVLMPASWEKALAAAGSALAKAGGRAAALAAGETTNEEAFLLQRLFREGLGSGHLASRAGGELPLDVTRALADPALQANVPDLEFANTVVLLESDPVDDAPILDLRIRKGARRHGVRIAVASARPTALDARADTVLRTVPGGGAALLVALDAALTGDVGDLGGAASAAGSSADAVKAFAEALSAAGEDIVIVFGERLLSGAGGDVAARALLNVASRLGLSGREGAGLLEIPASTNGRGLREAGFAGGHGPGYATLPAPGAGATAIAQGLADGDLHTLYLLHADPLRTHPDRALWEQALGTAQNVIAHESVLTETVREYADVVFPAEAYAEKEGTLVHPDGRLQRLRAAIGRAKGTTQGGGVRAGWQVIADVAARAGHDLGVAAGPIASRQLFETVPFYAGLTLDLIGGRGVRWPVHESAAANLGVEPWEPVALKVPRGARAARATEGALRLGTYRSLWSSKEVDVSPALQFIRPQQTVELSPADAERLGVADGDQVELGSNGTRVRGPARLRQAVPGGSVFIAEGTLEQPSNVLTDALVEIVRVGGPVQQPGAVATQVAPAVEGRAEAPPSAPLEIPPTNGHSGHGA
jgi:NADH-quinone oxidoreductase subunit G